MITFDSVTVTYEGAPAAALREVSVHVPAGELCLVVGPTGSGKTTLLHTVNGLVPHFTGGTLEGRVTVGGRDTATHPPRELADVVGLVRQDPSAGFVTDSVEDELAYTMESLGIAADVMRRRVEETLDLLGLHELRDRPLRSLSGGQQQRVAIGAVLTAHPQVLVMDEPTSALDPQAAEDVLAVVQRLVHDLGMTVVLSEHRLERVIQYADSVLLVSPSGSVRSFADPAAAMAESKITPPLVDLGRWAEWDPLPLSIRDARRRAGSLRGGLTSLATKPPAEPPTPPRSVVTLHAVDVRYRSVQALRDVSLGLPAGHVTAVIGRNGCGKSTALKVMCGAIRPEHGTARIAEPVGNDVDPATLHGRELVRRIALVPQDPGSLLWAETVGAECVAADDDAGALAGTALGLFHRFAPAVPSDRHPGDLSEGTRLMLVLAIMLTADPDVLLLDEPTRGLDYEAKTRLRDIVWERRHAGTAVAIASHDVEFIAETCDRVVMLAGGEVVLEQPVRQALAASPAFAPQIAKVLAPVPVMTMADLRAVLDSADGPPVNRPGSAR